MPFSILSEFKHTREAELRERNPRNVARNCGGTRTGEEKEGLAHRKSRHNVIIRKVLKKIQILMKTGRQIAPNSLQQLMKQFNKQTIKRNQACDNLMVLRGWQRECIYETKISICG